jgi:structural maintenance of chromosome 1
MRISLIVIDVFQNEAMMFGYMARIKQITASEAECRSKLDDFKEKQEALVAKQEDLDAELTSHKKQKASAQKQLVTSEKEVEKFSSQLADLDRTKHESQSQNAVNRRKLDDVDKRSKKSASAVKQIKDQIAKKRIEIEGLRSHLASVSSSKSSDISEADRDRLAQLKHELAVKSKEVEEGLNKAQSSKKSLTNSVQHLVDHDLPMLQRKLDDYNSKVIPSTYSAIARANAATQVQSDAESANTEELLAQKKRLEGELEALGQSIRKDEQQLKKLEDKLSEESDKLGKVKGHMKQKQQEEEFAKLLVSLKEQFGADNVLGRVMDLCQPRNPQHSLAVFAAMQSHMDSIVVRNIDVAERCIEHIKERKVSPKVFLPLNTIKPSSPSVDGIPRGIIVRPLIDLVEILVPQADIAVKFACGKTLFIESRDDAARVVGKKIVSLDGTVFSKSGAMQGGTTNSLSSRAESWKDAEASANALKFKAAVEDAKAAKSALAKKVSDAKAKKEAVSLDLTRVASQISMAEKRKIEADISSKQLKASRAYAEKDLARKQEDLKKAEASMAQLERTIEELTVQKDSLRKEVLGSFMKKLGKSIDEYDDLVKSYAEVQQKRNDIQKQLTAGEGELKKLLVSEKKYTEEADSTAKERAQIEAKIAEFDSKKKERESMDSSLRQKIKDAEKATSEAKSALSQVDERLHKAKSALDTVVSQLSEQKEAMMKLQRELDSISGRLADIEGDATTNGVTLPKLKNGSYDFSVLPRAATSTSSKDALTKFIEDSGARLVKVTAALEQLRPNFRYQEHMSTLEKELQDQNRKFEASLESSRKSAAAFEEVKKKRCALLRDFVVQVKDALNVTYGQLTSDDVHKDGGSAFLLDPDEEPYETGIRFEAIPPGKGYSSIDTLAGGEKSIAAIALLFAIHSVRPAPFIILDEVDSALDNRNLQVPPPLPTSSVSHVFIFVPHPSITTEIHSIHRASRCSEPDYRYQPQGEILRQERHVHGPSFAPMLSSQPPCHRTCVS